MENNGIIIEAQNLTKEYGEHTAVSDISFNIEKGRIYGFLGPNGAGKSTTMNMMTGCLSATEGTIKVGGFDILEEPEKAKALIGYLPEIPPLYVDRTPYEYLKFVAMAKKVARDELEEQIKHVLEVTATTDVADRLIKNLSKGYKQRIGIAQALLGNPEVIILDEPTVGLDPKQIIEIRELIKDLGKEHTVILSSHILSEVQAVCDTIIIISKGKLIACDTPDNLEKQFAGTSSISILTEASEREIGNILDKISFVESHECSPVGSLTRVTVGIGSEDMNTALRTIFFAFSDAKKAILEMNSSKASLEDIFIELTSVEDQASEALDEEASDEEASDEEAETESNEEEKEAEDK